MNFVNCMFLLQIIKNEASMISINEKLSVGEARKPENRSKNRYRDVSPCKCSRYTDFFYVGCLP
jgi:protein tyrosine phosphatase